MAFAPKLGRGDAVIPKELTPAHVADTLGQGIPKRILDNGQVSLGAMFVIHLMDERADAPRQLARRKVGVDVNLLEARLKRVPQLNGVRARRVVKAHGRRQNLGNSHQSDCSLPRAATSSRSACTCSSSAVMRSAAARSFASCLRMIWAANSWRVCTVCQLKSSWRSNVGST